MEDISVVEFAKVFRREIDTLNANATDAIALQCINTYPTWDGNSVPCKDGEQADRVRDNGKLYRCRQSHTSQPDWDPSRTPALWEVIDVEHAGTIDDPIPAAANMQYYSGKYYVEDGVLYCCTRDSGIPLAYLPSQLVGQYFEVVE